MPQRRHARTRVPGQQCVHRPGGGCRVDNRSFALTTAVYSNRVHCTNCDSDAGTDTAVELHATNSSTVHDTTGVPGIVHRQHVHVRVIRPEVRPARHRVHNGQALYAIRCLHFPQHAAVSGGLERYTCGVQMSDERTETRGLALISLTPIPSFPLTHAHCVSETPTYHRIQTAVVTAHQHTVDVGMVRRTAFHSIWQLQDSNRQQKVCNDYLPQRWSKSLPSTLPPRTVTVQTVTPVAASIATRSCD